MTSPTTIRTSGLVHGTATRSPGRLVVRDFGEKDPLRYKVSFHNERHQGFYSEQHYAERDQALAVYTARCAEHDVSPRHIGSAPAEEA